MRCSFCGDNGPRRRPYGECTPFRRIRHPKPFKWGYMKRHGLTRCDHCQRLWNQDVNGACNIWKIAFGALAGRPRPGYLS